MILKMDAFRVAGTRDMTLVEARVLSIGFSGSVDCSISNERFQGISVDVLVGTVCRGIYTVDADRCTVAFEDITAACT